MEQLAVIFDVKPEVKDAEPKPAPVVAYLEGVINRIDAEQAAAGSYESWLSERAWRNATQQDRHFPLVCHSMDSAVAEALRLAEATDENAYVLPAGDRRFRIALAAEVGEDGPNMLGYAAPGYKSSVEWLSRPARFVAVAEFQSDIASRVSGRAMLAA